MFNQTQDTTPPLTFILAGSGFVLALAGGIALAVAANHRRQSLPYKIKQGIYGLQKELHRFERSYLH